MVEVSEPLPSNAPESWRHRVGQVPPNASGDEGEEDRTCPEEFAEALPAAFAEVPRTSTEFPLVLISGGRRAAAYNSWTHNIPKLMEKLKGNFVSLNPHDADSLGISDGDRVRVVSPSGALEIEAFATPSIRPGVVMIHQFWGHKYESGMKTSREHPGGNVNLLHDDQVRDRFTGMPVYNGTPCRIERLP